MILPTLTPAMRTSSPGFRPPASDNAAEWLAAAEQRELVGVEGEQQHRRDDGEPDGPDDDGVALTEGCHH